MTAPFSLGSKTWPGLSKLMEEAGEVVQVGGKLMGTGGATNHWDGTNLAERMEEELADLQAAILFFIMTNALDSEKIGDRVGKKVAQFMIWHKQ